MNREFEILNEKLNIIFEELMWLKKGLLREKYEKEVKELEYKAKDAQREVEHIKDDSRYNNLRLDDRMDHFRNIERNFHRVEETCERVER